MTARPAAEPRLAISVLIALIALIALAAFALPPAPSEPIAVKHTEGIVHGFLVLRTLDGVSIADGDLIQTARGDRVTTRLVFHFKDGSVSDETAVYSQRDEFRLVSDHLVQNGPSFPRAIDMVIDAAGQVTVRSTNEHGEAKSDADHMDLPPDLANGLLLTLLKNITPGHTPTTWSFVAATPKPRLVKLALSAAGTDRFVIGRTTRDATHYVVKVELGGVSGLLAPLVGKQPPDAHVWILGGEAPAFVKSEQQLYMGGPIWRIELTSPVWPSQN